MANTYMQFSAKLDLVNEAEAGWFKRHLEFDPDDLDDPAHACPSLLSLGCGVRTPLSSEARLFTDVVIDNGDGEAYEFCWSVRSLSDGSRYIWFYSEKSGSPYQVCCVVHAFFRAMRPKGGALFILSWCEWCDKMLIDAFRGGTMVATKEGIGVCSDEQIEWACEHIVYPWLEKKDEAAGS